MFSKYLLKIFFKFHMANKLLYLFIAVVLVVLLVLLSDPFMLWMPAPAQMVILLAIAVLVCVWSGFVMYEHTSDERDALHRMNAARMAYLSGLGVLTTALVVQGLAHDIDVWISITLGVMVLVKLGSRFYSDKYQ